LIRLSEDVFFAKPEDIDPESNVVATYYVESELRLPEAGKQIALEESIGTWTEVTTTTAWIKEKLSAKVFKWEGRNKGLVSIAFPNELFDIETGGIPNILSIVAGNLFGLSALKNVRLLDIELPSVLTIQTGINEPRYVSIMGIRKVAQKEIKVLGLQDLGMKPEEAGGDGSLTVVERVSFPPVGEGAQILEGTMDEISDKVIAILKEKGGVA